MKEPMVTVVIPVYNGEKFLKQTIKSVLNQTYPNLILKIFDNRSTDNTREIVESFDDSRINYIRNEKNIGMLPNWKKALGSARTKYASVLFADDFYKPKFLEKTVKILEKYPKLGLAAVGCEIYNEKNELKTVRKRQKYGLFSNKEFFNILYLLYDVPPPSETVLLNKIVQNVGGYDIKNLNWIVDADLYLRIAKAGYGAYYLKDILSCRRSWEGNSTLSISYTHKNINDRYYLLNKYFDIELLDEKIRMDSYYNVWNNVKRNLFTNLKQLNFNEMKIQYNIFKNNDIHMKNNKSRLNKLKSFSELTYFFFLIQAKQLLKIN